MVTGGAPFDIANTALGLEVDGVTGARDDVGLGTTQARESQVEILAGYADDDHALADGLVDAIVGSVTAT